MSREMKRILSVSPLLAVTVAYVFVGMGHLLAIMTPEAAYAVAAVISIIGGAIVTQLLNLAAGLKKLNIKSDRANETAERADQTATHNAQQIEVGNRQKALMIEEIQGLKKQLDEANGHASQLQSHVQELSRRNVELSDALTTSLRRQETADDTAHQAGKALLEKSGYLAKPDPGKAGA